MRRVSLVLAVIGMIGSGCQQASEPSPAAKQGEAAAPVEPAVAAEPPKPEGFSQVTFKLVDKRKSLQDNPALVEVKNTTNASDPWTAAAQSYFTIGSKTSLLALQHGIELHKAQFEKPPTFAEFETMYRQAGVQFKGLYPWQVYAYDDEQGTVCILEDRAEKKRMHEEKGVPYAEEEQGERIN
ncbi:MAG: hypothetical protein KDA90_07170 [Planctomycetaceae bacterium]|nr:hypothetical protein [Planctomycetaceae bacterium]